MCLLSGQADRISDRYFQSACRGNAPFAIRVTGFRMPVTAGHPADSFSPFSNGYAAGTGPVYALLGGASNGVVGFSGRVGGWYGC